MTVLGLLLFVFLATTGAEGLRQVTGNGVLLITDPSGLTTS